MNYQHISLTYLDTIAADDEELRKTLLEMVHQELSSAIPNMMAAYDRQEWATLHGIVHKLKSTLAFVGNQELTATNRLLLNHLEQENYTADFPALLRLYQQLFPLIEMELRKELAQLA